MTFWQRIEDNRRRTVWLFVAFFLLTAAVAWALQVLLEDWLAPIALMGVAGLTAVGALVADSKLVLGWTGAHKATPEEFRMLSNVVDEMAIAAQLPRPDLYVLQDAAPNAFATGTPGKGTVVVTTGLLAKLDRDELAGVVAHEMAHIGNHDTRVMTVAFVLLWAISLLCDLSFRWQRLGAHTRQRRSRSKDKDGAEALKLLLAVVVILLAPLMAKLLTYAVSRRREYLADAEAARLTRNPRALARALRKIALDDDPVDTASLATAHLFIVSPLRQESSFLSSNWFSTHPPIEERIRLLENM